jgi:hypothetical protein
MAGQNPKRAPISSRTRAGSEDPALVAERDVFAWLDTRQAPHLRLLQVDGAEFGYGGETEHQFTASVSTAPPGLKSCLARTSTTAQLTAERFAQPSSRC